MNKFSAIAFLLSACGASVACRAEQHTKAEYCVAINVYGDESKALINPFDQFAISHELLFDKRDPSGRYYEGDNKGFSIGLTSNMGEFGAIVTFFRFSASAHGADAALRDLKQLVDDRIASQYKVRACGDIEGFKIPEVRQ